MYESASCEGDERRESVECVVEGESVECADGDWKSKGYVCCSRGESVRRVRG